MFFCYRLHTFVRKSSEDVLNSAEEKLEEQKTWLEPEDPADNFSDAKEQQDKIKVRIDLDSFCSNTGSIRDDPYWTSKKNSLELIELSSINKVSLV